MSGVNRKEILRVARQMGPDVQLEVEAELENASPADDVAATDEEAQYAIEKLREELRSARQDREQRKEYSDKLFQLVVWILGGLGFIVFLDGLEAAAFSVGDEALRLLIVSTVGSVIGLFHIVARYLFPRNGG